MKIVNLNNNFYLVDSNMNRMAKDLPKDTLVFCLSEVHTNDSKECIRKSTKDDNCYGCQPLIASTDSKIGIKKLNMHNLPTTELYTYLNESGDVMDIGEDYLKSNNIL